jgi:hypothetical protein
MGLLNVSPPPFPRVVLTIRSRGKYKNTGRILSIKEDVEKVIREGNMMELVEKEKKERKVSFVSFFSP